MPPQLSQLDEFMADLEKSGLIVAEAAIAAEASAAPAAAEAAEAAAGGPSVLPPGWMQAADPENGDVYYFRPETGEVTWDRPGGDQQPLPPQGAPPEVGTGGATGHGGGGADASEEDDCEGAREEDAVFAGAAAADDDSGNDDDDEEEEEEDAEARVARFLSRQSLVDVSALGSLILATVQDSVDRLLGAAPHPKLQARPG